jgi:invasion protein IalB
MDVRTALGLPRWGARALVVGLATSLLPIGAAAFGQIPPAAQPKAPPRGPSANSAPQPQAGARTIAQPPAAEAQAPQLIYSPWTKVCLKGQEANAPQACFTAKDGRVESGMLVVGAVLIEPEGEAKKFLRITLPLGMQLSEGTRVIVDKSQPLTAPYSTCLANGCMADYVASEELIGNMKSGEGLVVQGTNNQGQVIRLVVPLNDFGKAYDGPPTDPKVSEQQQKKLRDDLQKRAEEAREKLEEQQQKRLQDDMQKRAEEVREKLLESLRPSR